MTSNSEIWKDIPGYEGRYQASTEGRIRSVDHRVRVVVHGKEATRITRGQVLRPGRQKSGHVSVVLGHGAHGSQVHQLIMLTFVGPVPEGCEVCHNDGNPANNALNNLRYDTRSENILDEYRAGRIPRGKTHPATVKEIRKRLKNGEPGCVIARDVGLSETQISRIKLGKVYAWLK